MLDLLNYMDVDSMAKVAWYVSKTHNILFTESPTPMAPVPGDGLLYVFIENNHRRQSWALCEIRKFRIRSTLQFLYCLKRRSLILFWTLNIYDLLQAV